MKVLKGFFDLNIFQLDCADVLYGWCRVGDWDSITVGRQLTSFRAFCSSEKSGHLSRLNWKMQPWQPLLSCAPRATTHDLSFLTPRIKLALLPLHPWEEVLPHLRVFLPQYIYYFIIAHSCSTHVGALTMAFSAFFVQIAISWTYIVWMFSGSHTQLLKHEHCEVIKGEAQFRLLAMKMPIDQNCDNMFGEEGQRESTCR